MWKKEKIEEIIKRLEKTGINVLVVQILEAFGKEYPNRREVDLALFLEHFMAREYGITRRMEDYNVDIAALMTQIRTKARLEFRRAQEARMHEAKIQEVKMRETKTPSFLSKSINELAEEGLAYIKQLYRQNPNDVDYLDKHDVRQILTDFFKSHYPVREDYSTGVKKSRVRDVLYGKLVENRIERELSSEHRENLEEFKRKTTEELAKELVSFFKKEHTSALFDNRQSSLGSVFRAFWPERYPVLESISNAENDLGSPFERYHLALAFAWIYEKQREAQRITGLKLPNVKEQVANEILNRLLQSASDNKKSSFTHNDVLVLLDEWGLHLPERERKILYAKVNNILRRGVSK